MITDQAFPARLCLLLLLTQRFSSNFILTQSESKKVENKRHLPETNFHIPQLEICRGKVQSELVIWPQSTSRLVFPIQERIQTQAREMQIRKGFLEIGIQPSITQWVVHSMEHTQWVVEFLRELIKSKRTHSVLEGLHTPEKVAFCSVQCLHYTHIEWKHYQGRDSLDIQNNERGLWDSDLQESKCHAKSSLQCDFRGLEWLYSTDTF